MSKRKRENCLLEPTVRIGEEHGREFRSTTWKCGCKEYESWKESTSGFGSYDQNTQLTTCENHRKGDYIDTHARRYICSAMHNLGLGVRNVEEWSLFVQAIELPEMKSLIEKVKTKPPEDDPDEYRFV